MSFANWPDSLSIQWWCRSKGFSSFFTLPLQKIRTKAMQCDLHEIRLTVNTYIHTHMLWWNRRRDKGGKVMSMKRKIEFSQLMRFALARSLSPTRFFENCHRINFGCCESFFFFNEVVCWWCKEWAFYVWAMVGCPDCRQQQKKLFTFQSCRNLSRSQLSSSQQQHVFYIFKRPTRRKIEIQ